LRGGRGRPPVLRPRPETAREREKTRLKEREQEADGLPIYEGLEGDYPGDMNEENWRRRAIATVPNNPNNPPTRARQIITHEVGPYNERRSIQGPRANRGRATTEDPGQETRKKKARTGGNLHKYKRSTKISTIMEELWRSRWEK